MIDALVAEAIGRSRGASRIAVLTGAGISTDAGIPDFRGPNGVWTKDPQAERASTLQHYLADPQVRRAAWRGRLTSPMWGAQPAPGHVAIVDLEHAGLLEAVVTQNVDGLHQRAGSAPGRVLEVHGSAWGWMCWTCGAKVPMVEALDRVRAGNPDPGCLVCGGILKSTTISFGQQLDPEVIDAAVAAVRSCDCLWAVGTTLTVHPVAGLVPFAARHAPIVIINAEETPYDDLAAVVRVPIGTALPAMVAALTGPKR